MHPTRIEPHRITRPMQAVGALLAAMVITSGAFLLAASKLQDPKWVFGLLVIAAVAVVPLFLVAAFFLLTKYRPHLQEDKYFAPWVRRVEKQSPEQQREKLERKITAISPPGLARPELQGPKTPRAETVSLRTQYLLAETLVIRQLEAEYGESIDRSAFISRGDPPIRIAFDGALMREGVLVAIEVRFVPKFALEPAQVLTKAISNVMSQIKQFASVGESPEPFGSSVVLLLALVTDGPLKDERSIRRKIADLTKDSPTSVEVRFFDLTELKRRFGVHAGSDV